MEKKRFAISRQTFLATLLLLLGVMGILFFQSILPGRVHFNNDGPLGLQAAKPYEMPQAYSGVWVDLNAIGIRGGTPAVSPTYLLKWAVGPRWFLSLYPPTALLLLGCGAWFFFRQLKLSPLACTLGALATTLTSTFFSAACWGVASQEFAIAFDFFALGLVVSAAHTVKPSVRWAKILLAGFAIGINITEGADIGAILSVLIAALAVYYTLLIGSGSAPQRAIIGVSRVAVIALFAGWLASGVVLELLGTQIKGVAGMSETPEGKAEHWEWATQWSFPKRETLALVVPGIFGFRMDTPEGGNYWGIGGSSQVWDKYLSGDRKGPPPDQNVYMLRQAGGGVYAGVIVVFVALWAALQSFRKNSVFNLTERRLLWFWVAAAIVSLLLAFGRFAPFYRLVYELPYFSTIRNPSKFIIIFIISLVVLFAYGVHGLATRYLNVPGSSASSLGARFRVWWAKASIFDRRWVIGSIAAIVFSLLAWLIYYSSRGWLIQYLQAVQFDESMARSIAEFSIKQVGWFVLFLTLSVVLVTLILSGAFAGRMANRAAVLLGLILVIDLARANLPWIRYEDYKVKYATNPILDFLRQKPYEHRVAVLPFRFPQQPGSLNNYFDQMYRLEWAQHHFPFYNVQSLDIVQMPRPPQDWVNYQTALQPSPNAPYLFTRRWELSNTRFLLGPAGYLDVLNQQLDPERHRFRIVQTFNLTPKPEFLNPSSLVDLTAEPAAGGGLAIFEFTGALPRAKLYSHWQMPAKEPAEISKLKSESLSTIEIEYLKSIGTNDFLTLQDLAAPDFDPQRTVLLADTQPVPGSANVTNQNVGSVDFTSYAPKDIQLKTKAAAESVLLLNDKYDPNWQVYVDGKRAELLRANYIMRGVYVPAGEHSVRFRFKTDVRPLYVSVAAEIVAVGLLGFLTLSRMQSSKVDKPQPPAR